MNDIRNDAAKNNDARSEAQRLARELGDRAWKAGNTKHALEAWEASDITALELLEKTRILLEMAGVVGKFREQDEEHIKLISNVTSRPASRTGSKNAAYCVKGAAIRMDAVRQSCDEHPLCKARLEWLRQFQEEICGKLGWEMTYPSFYVNASSETPFLQSSFYEAAAVACLKLIKRIG